MAILMSDSFDEPDHIRSKIIGRVYRIPCSLICIATVIFQAYVTNHYLVSNYDKWWLFWITADIFVIFLFVTSFIVCSFYLFQKARKKSKIRKYLGELPLAYITWFIYSVFLATRVAIIFKNFAYKLSEDDFFGPNTLKTNISLSSIVFFLHVLIHADLSPNSKRDAWINNIIFRISMDLLDTVAFLEILFVEETRVLLSFEMHKSIVAIGCINLILPTIPLVVLSFSSYGRSEVPTIIDTVHIAVYLVAVNVPVFVTRLLLWHVHSYDVSVFIIKNVLSLGLFVKKIVDHLADIYKDVVVEREKAGKHGAPGPDGQEMSLRGGEDQPTTELSEGQARSVFI